VVDEKKKKEEAEGMVSKVIIGDEGCKESSECGEGMCESAQGTRVECEAMS
jgi:hypothetical protein